MFFGIFSIKLPVNFGNDRDENWMDVAIKEAEKAFEEGEMPVGAVIVHNNILVGKGHNQRERLKDPTAHAEIIAITSAAGTLDSWRLADCTIYVTLEPCPMCAGAILNARIPRVVYGTDDATAGMCGSVDNLCDRNLMNHRAIVKSGVKAEICQSLLDAFFRRLRDRKEAT